MKGEKYIKHGDKWCPISREHRDPAEQAAHNAAAKKVVEATPDPPKQPEPKKRETPQEWQHRKVSERHTPKKYNNEHEASVDNKIADLHRQAGAAHLAFERAFDAIHYAVRDKKDKHGNWGMNWEETKQKFDSTEHLSGYGPDGKQKLLKEVTEASNAAKAISEQYKEAQKEYKGWSRFFLVQGPNGHIHDSMNCHTCTPSTDYAWLPDLSGLEAKDAVDAHGPRLCSHCFPDAPADWTKGVERDKSGECSASGTSPASYKWGDRYVKCPDCGETVSVSRAGNIRSHKPPTDDEKKIRNGLDKSAADNLAFHLKLKWRGDNPDTNIWGTDTVNGKTAKLKVLEIVGKKKLYGVEITEDGKTRTVSTRSEARELDPRG